MKNMWPRAERAALLRLGHLSWQRSAPKYNGKRGDGRGGGRGEAARLGQQLGVFGSQLVD